MSNADNSETVATAGTLLRQAREAAGMHIAALAVAIKVPVKKLEALEADRLDLLPDAVFARALASSMCRTLKIDPAPVLEKLPVSKKVSLTVEARSANEPFNKSTYSASGSPTTMLGKPAMLIVLALLLGVALILLVPATDDAPPPSEPTVEEVVPHFPLEPAKQPVEEIIEVPLPNASAPVVPSPVVPPSVTDTTPAPVVPAPKQDAVSAPVAQSSVSANHVVVFKVRGPSWVEVTDAKGVVQLRRNMEEGQEAGAAGALPMVVVVGRADITDVLVRGKPFDVSKLAVGNVARFEVK